MDAALFESAPTSKRYPKEMYYRLLSPLILPREVERVLYLDPDMLIINPLRPLWEMDLYGKNLCSGVPHGAHRDGQRHQSDAAGHGARVFQLRRHAHRPDCRPQAGDGGGCPCLRQRARKELILPDQDVFNILYGKETRPVEDVLWNYDVRNYSKYLIRSTGKHDLSWVMRNTAVLHFCGRNKAVARGTIKTPSGCCTCTT